MPLGSALADEGSAALAAGRWADAAVLLEGAAAEHSGTDRTTCLDKLADALWWLGETQRAIEVREQVYRDLRAAGDPDGAARTAAWLAREHAAGTANLPAARGWLARARTIVASVADRQTRGWVELAASVLADAAPEQVAHASEALACARGSGDGDLEALALARLGLAQVILGEVSAGLDHLDEAMAATTAGETRLSTTPAQLCCDFLLAAELAGDARRFGRWAGAVERVAARSEAVSPLTFCTTCCAEQAVAMGDFAGAERQLHLAVVELDDSGGTSRCVRPTAKLAELLLLQGRLEEAVRAAGDADDASSLVVRARIALAQRQPQVAVALAERAARRDGPRIPAQALLVQAHVEAGDNAQAETALVRLDALVATSGDPPARANLALCRGRLAAAQGEDRRAVQAYESALDEVEGIACLEAATAHLELARLRAGELPSVARLDAARALTLCESMGALQAADAAASLLRALGDHSRVGPKGVGPLSRREQEVLRLVAQGLTNAEIAARLFISTKTAGNHVSAILAKLGARTRTEAAARAEAHLGPR